MIGRQGGRPSKRSTVQPSGSSANVGRGFTERTVGGRNAPEETTTPTPSETLQRRILDRSAHIGIKARSIELAGQVNGFRPKHVVQKVADALNSRKQSLNGSRILVTGVAYKPDVSDTRQSPALEIIHLLRERGAYVLYHDPHVPELKMDGEAMKSLPLTASPVDKKQKRSGLLTPPGRWFPIFGCPDSAVPFRLRGDCHLPLRHRLPALDKEARLPLDSRNTIRNGSYPKSAW